MIRRIAGDVTGVIRIIKSRLSVTSRLLLILLYGKFLRCKYSLISYSCINYVFFYLGRCQNSPSSVAAPAGKIVVLRFRLPHRRRIDHRSRHLAACSDFLFRIFRVAVHEGDGVCGRSRGIAGCLHFQADIGFIASSRTGRIIRNSSIITVSSITAAQIRIRRHRVVICRSAAGHSGNTAHRYD